MTAEVQERGTGGDPGDRLPREFGRYLLFDHIGKGGMADIFLALARTDLGGSRRVVVKQILRSLGADPAFSDMLVSEAKLAAKLSHANVVQVFDLGSEASRLFIAMEYVEGFDLNELLRRLTKARIGLPAEFALLILREALRGLDYAHRARDDSGRPLGIVHRDVSPSNVLISFEGEVKLCDFGIARALMAEADAEADEVAERRTRLAGKCAYMSPEHARGEDIDARADVFAAGILCWELCAGRRLYRGSEEEMLAQAREGAVKELPDRGLPEQDRLAGILARALSPDPDDRYETAGKMLGDLEAYAASVGLMASPLRLGSFLTDHFAPEILEQRRRREQAAHAVARALAKGPPVVLVPVEVGASADARPEGGPGPGAPGGGDDDERRPWIRRVIDSDLTVPLLLLSVAIAILLILTLR